MADSVFLNRARAEQAIALADPSIRALMDSVANHKSLHIVVLGCDGHVLHEQTVGPSAVADRERMVVCSGIARSKAAIHFRTGRPAAEIQARRPHALHVGDTLYGGSAAHEGIIVAASGVQSHFDESISAMIAAILWGLCMEAQAGHLAKTDKGPHYQKAL